MFRPADDARDADAALVERPLLVAQGARRSVRMNSRDRRPVVAGEKDEGVAAQTKLVDGLGQPSKGIVELRDVAVMSSIAGIVGKVEIGETLVARDRLVRLVVADIDEERFRPVPDLFQPVNGLVGHQRRGIALELSDRFAVADEVVGIAVIRQGIVLRGKPVVEAMIRGLRLGRQIEVAVEMPFPDMAGVVSSVPQQRRDRDLLPPEVHGGEHGNPVVHPDPVGRPPRHEPGPRRGAIRRRRVAARQPQSFARQPVQVGRLDSGMTVTSQIAVTQIVCQHDQEVRPRVLLRYRRPEGEERQQRDDRSERHGRFSSREPWFLARGTCTDL